MSVLVAWRWLKLSPQSSLRDGVPRRTFPGLERPGQIHTYATRRRSGPALTTTSESQPQAKLHLAHRVRRGDNAKAGGRRTRGRNGVARLSEVHVVEGIRCLSPKAQLDALGQTKVARDGQIHRLITRPIEKIA